MKIEELKKQMPDIFERVKQDVSRIVKKHRAGLTLGLAEMGISQRGFIGGMFFSGGTMILMNLTALRYLCNDISQSDEVIIGYTYHILLHEYIHSLGILDEAKCRQFTFHITKEVFLDEANPAYIMAKKGIGAYFPEIIYAPMNFQIGTPLHVEMIRDFDKSSMRYYS